MIDERPGTELANWAENGFRKEPTNNILTYGSPDEEYTLSVKVDDPVEGFLIQLERRDGGLLGRAILEDSDLAEVVAHEFAERVDRYAGLGEL